MRKNVATANRMTLNALSILGVMSLATCNPPPPEKKVRIKKPKPLTNKEAKAWVKRILDDNDTRDWESSISIDAETEERLRRWSGR